MRRRDIQAQRQAKEAMRNWELIPFDPFDGEESRQDDKPFTLSDGSPINPADAWPVPQQAKED